MRVFKLGLFVVFLLAGQGGAFADHPGEVELEPSGVVSDDGEFEIRFRTHEELEADIERHDAVEHEHAEEENGHSHGSHEHDDHEGHQHNDDEEGHHVSDQEDEHEHSHDHDHAH